MVESSPCNKWAGVQTPVNHNVFHANNYSVNGNAIINCVNGNVVILQVHSFPVKVNVYFYLSMAKSILFTVIYCNFQDICQQLLRYRWQSLLPATNGLGFKPLSTIMFSLLIIILSMVMLLSTVSMVMQLYYKPILFLSRSMPIPICQWQSQSFSESYTAILRVIASSGCGTDGRVFSLQQMDWGSNLCQP